MEKQTINRTIKIYSIKNICNFNIVWDTLEQKEILSAMCLDVIRDLEILELPGIINVSRRGLQIEFKVKNTKERKAFIQMVNQAIKDLK